MIHKQLLALDDLFIVFMLFLEVMVEEFTLIEIVTMLRLVKSVGLDILDILVVTNEVCR